MRLVLRRQQGATLLVTLVMLIMLTLIAIGAMNTSTTNLQIVGNMQQRTEAMAAAQHTIETTISTANFVTMPANAIPNPCNGVANTLCTDLNGDGTPDLTTRLDPPPACSEGRVIQVSELSIPGPTAPDVACLQAQQQTFGVAGAAPSGESLCGTTVWDISAVTMQSGTTAATSGLKYGATLGVGLRVKALDVASNCP